MVSFFQHPLYPTEPLPITDHLVNVPVPAHTKGDVCARSLRSNGCRRCTRSSRR
jgi:hypothetical protein